MSVIWLAAVLATTAGGVRAARHRAHAAADLAALAASSHAAAGPAAACRWAAMVAAGSSGRLSACGLRGHVVDVTVTVAVRGPAPLGRMRVIARARAGPIDPVP
jgi:secretion/DNA translocation related TadE-like protein